MEHYKVIAVHGEGRTLFHVVNAAAPEAEQPTIIRTWQDRQAAEMEADELNRLAELHCCDTELFGSGCSICSAEI